MWAPAAITTASKPYLSWHSALPNTAGISRQLCMQVFRITLLSCHSLCPCSTLKNGYAASDIIFAYTLYLSPPSRSPYFPLRHDHPIFSPVLLFPIYSLTSPLTSSILLTYIQVCLIPAAPLLSLILASCLNHCRQGTRSEARSAATAAR